MRVLHYVGIGLLPKDPDADAVGGTERVALELARVQVARGAEVCVAGPGAQGWRGDWRGVSVRHLPQVKALGPKLAAQLPLAALTWSGRFDVVHLHEHPRPELLGGRLIVVQSHNDFGGETGSPGFAWEARQFWAGAGRGHVQLGVSRYLAKRFVDALDTLGAPPRHANVGVCPNGVDLDRFRGGAAASSRAELRRAWGFGPDEVAFLYAGAIHEVKGIDALVSAFADLAAREPRARLVVAGGSRLWHDEVDPGAADAYEAEMLARLQPLVDAGRVRPLGLTPHRDMPAVFAAADVLVLPSIVHETFGLVVVEAFAMGKPVVASRVGGVVELVAPGRNGLLVPPGEPDVLVEAMAALVRDPELRARLAEGARRSAGAFSWEASVDRLDGIYQAALAGVSLPNPFGGDGMLDALSQGLDMS